MENFNHHAKTILATVERARREGEPEVFLGGPTEDIVRKLNQLSEEPMALPLTPLTGNDARTIRLIHPMKSTLEVSDENQAIKCLLRFWLTGAGISPNDDSVGVVLYPNVQGVAVALRYDSHGIFSVAFTRGDGSVGIDITPHFLAGIAEGTIRAPISISEPFAETGGLEIRGILYCEKKDYEGSFSSSVQAVNAVLQAPPTSPFPIALYFCATDVRTLVVSYPLLSCASCKTKLLECLKGFGFEIPFYMLVQVPTQDVFVDFERFEEGRTEIQKGLRSVMYELEKEEVQKSFPYEIDGTIISTDDFKHYITSYLTTSEEVFCHNSRTAKEVLLNMVFEYRIFDIHQVLLKRDYWPFESRVEDVVWEHVNFNNHFSLSAVVKITPVTFNGSKIDHAVLGSILRVEQLATGDDPDSPIQTLHLGINPAYPISKGAVVSIKMGSSTNGVPTVHSVIRPGTESLVVPVSCPHCHAEVNTRYLSVLNANVLEDYALHIVHTHRCVVRESQTISLVLHRLRRLNISPYLVQTLFSLGHLPNGLASMFSLNVEKLTSVPEVTEQMAHEIVNALDTKDRPLQWENVAKVLFLSADWVNSAGFSLETFPLVMDRFKTFKAFEKAHKTSDREQLTSITHTLPDSAERTEAYDAGEVISAVDAHAVYVIDVINKMLKEKVNVCTKTQSDRARWQSYTEGSPLEGKKVKLINFSSWSGNLQKIDRVITLLGGRVVLRGDADIYLFEAFKGRRWYQMSPDKEKFLLSEFLDKFAL